MDWLPAIDRCIIVASGPGAIMDPVRRQHDFWPTIAINESWRLVPWAMALYACDGDWWRHADGAPDFRGLKITQDGTVAREYPGLKVVEAKRTDDLIVGLPGVIGTGHNSAFQALNLAVNMGAKTIALVGVDLGSDRGSHWHGDHPAPMRNADDHAFARMRAAFERAAPKLDEIGVKVWNCSPVSTLDCFERAALGDVVWRRKS